MTKRNAVVRSEAQRLGFRVVETMAAANVSRRCDGVHFMCVLTPALSTGPPTSLRAPCARCDSRTLVDFWRDVLSI